MVSHYTRRSYVSYDCRSYGYLYTTRSKIMKQIHAYLNPKDEQGIEDMRIQHLLNSLDKMDNEIRIYIQGLDFQKAALHPHHEVPFITIDGKKKSFDNAWQEILGDKEHDTDI